LANCTTNNTQLAIKILADHAKRLNKKVKDIIRKESWNSSIAIVEIIITSIHYLYKMAQTKVLENIQKTPI